MLSATVTPAQSVHQTSSVPASGMAVPYNVGGQKESADDSLPPNPAPLPKVSAKLWIAELRSKIESEKNHLRSTNRLHENGDGKCTINPTVSEKFFKFLRSAVDSIAGLLGRKEQSLLSGYCAVSALVRGATPALKQLSSSKDVGITGLILTSAYLVTTSVNLATAVSAYARSYATQGEHLQWVINNLPAVEKFLKDQNKNQATSTQAKIFNEFMLRIENIPVLMAPMRLKEGANKSATQREAVAMLPGGIVSEISGINAFTKTISTFVSGVLSEVGAIFQVAGGVLDIKQALTEKKIVHINIADARSKMNALENLEGDRGSPIFKSFLTAFSNLQKAAIRDHESQWLNTDFRLFKGSMAIPAGLAGATFTAFLIAKALGVFVLASATIALTTAALSVLSGVILLAFLGRLAYVGYCGWKSAKKSIDMAEKAKACVSDLSSPYLKKGLTNFPNLDEVDSNPYLKLDQFAKILVNGQVDVGFKNKFEISQQEAKDILAAVGVPGFYLESLLLEAKARGTSGVEWFKSKIGKYLNIDYSFTEGAPEPSAKAETSSKPGKVDNLPLRPTHKTII